MTEENNINTNPDDYARACLQLAIHLLKETPTPLMQHNNVVAVINFLNTWLENFPTSAPTEPGPTGSPPAVEAPESVVAFEEARKAAKERRKQQRAQKGEKQNG